MSHRHVLLEEVCQPQTRSAVEIQPEHQHFAVAKQRPSANRPNVVSYLHFIRRAFNTGNNKLGNPMCFPTLPIDGPYLAHQTQQTLSARSCQYAPHLNKNDCCNCHFFTKMLVSYARKHRSTCREMFVLLRLTTCVQIFHQLMHSHM